MQTPSIYFFLVTMIAGAQMLQVATQTQGCAETKAKAKARAEHTLYRVIDISLTSQTLNFSHRERLRYRNFVQLGLWYWNWNWERTYPVISQPDGACWVFIELLPAQRVMYLIFDH